MVESRWTKKTFKSPEGKTRVPPDVRDELHGFRGITEEFPSLPIRLPLDTHMSGMDPDMCVSPGKEIKKSAILTQLSSFLNSHQPLSTTQPRR